MECSDLSFRGETIGSKDSEEPNLFSLFAYFQMCRASKVKAEEINRYTGVSKAKGSNAQLITHEVGIENKGSKLRF